MTAVMDAETRAALDAVNTDHRPARRDARAELRDAVLVVAALNDGLVHIADVRPLLPRWVAPHTVGAFIAGLANQGVLIDTGITRPYGGPKQGHNSYKPAKVRRLVKPIPEVTR